MTLDRESWKMIRYTITDNGYIVSAVFVFHSSDANFKKLPQTVKCVIYFPVSFIEIIFLVFYFIYSY